MTSPKALRQIKHVSPRASVISRGQRYAVLLAALVALTMGTLVGAPMATAAETGPVWKILSVADPTHFKPGDQSGADSILVTAVNVGSASTGCTAEQVAAEPRPSFSPVTQCSGASPTVAPVTISDQLPANLTAIEVFGVNAYRNPFGKIAEPGEGTGPPFGLACTLASGHPSCATGEPIAPGDTLVMTIKVKTTTVTVGSDEVNRASVSGGGALTALVSAPVTISATPASYGLAENGNFAALSTTQAGAHPNFTTAFFLNTISQPAPTQNYAENPGYPKDVNFALPPGLVGSTVGFARCPIAEVVAEANCPRDTMVGTATIILGGVGGIPRNIITVPVFNITPAPGEPAAFGIDALFFPVRLDTSVQPDGEYRVRVSTPDITGAGAPYMTSITIWGDPAEHSGPGPDAASHSLKGPVFLEGNGRPEFDFGGPGAEEFESADHETVVVNQQRQVLLTNPSQCSQALSGELSSDSWEAPGAFTTEGVPVGAESGCGLLSFGPSLSVASDSLQAGAPAGYTLNIGVPQALSSEPEVLGTANVKSVVTTLPAGAVLSPSAANGLGSCSNALFGLGSAAPSDCPPDSQIGTVRVKSPADEEALGGSVFLGAPECEPCSPADAAAGRMVRLFIQIEAQPEAAIEGPNPVLVKLEGRGVINQQTGQLTTTFTGLPQLPFSDFRLILNGGERAALANPRTCGTAATAMDLTPWSTPNTPDAELSSAFQINTGLGESEGECGGAPQFAPSFTAGASRNQAASFSPVTLTFGRADTDEYIGGLQVTAPAGLLGMIASVPLCPEPQAAQGTCPSSSLIGETSAYVGPGGDPYHITGGRVYLTGPYRGAPYGATIVLPAKAGPFTLAGTSGNGTVVVRATVTVNPQTGAFTVTTDPLPTELDGIPLQVRQVTTILGTNGSFTFNPTSCEKLQWSATLTSVGNSAAPRTESFQDTNCAALGFKPSFTVSTDAATSKSDGASLDVKIATKEGPQTPEGQQESNIHKVDVQLPISLPSRLSTLQKACTEQQYAANPANCPEGSFVGTAVARTPALSAPLEGPAILVSHGGAKFPDLVIVLQGDGVVVDLTGNTDIKHGVTYSKFETAPDAPISSFELRLPEGPHSVLGSYISNGTHNFCRVPTTVTRHVTKRLHGRSKKLTVKTKTLAPAALTMPTTITAQDGAVIKQATKIALTGCPTAAAARKAAAAKRAALARRARSTGKTGR